MFARIKTPEDWYRNHVAIILDLDDSYLGSECNATCAGLDPLRWKDCVCRLKPDFRDWNHKPSYGFCFWDDRLTQDCAGMSWLGCSKHDHAHIRGPCSVHKCETIHNEDLKLWPSDYRAIEPKNDTVQIWQDMQGCYEHYMKRGDPIVYSGHDEIESPSLSDYAERLSMGRRLVSLEAVIQYGSSELEPAGS